MEQSVEVGDVWIAKDRPELELKVFAVSGDEVVCKINKGWGGYVKGELVTYTKDTLFRIYAKEVDKVYFDGYQEGYKFGHLDGKKEGYESGYADCSEKLHSIFGERELEIEKDAFQEGYAQAYSELHAPTTERERQLQEKAWDEGYVSAIEDYLAQGGEFIGNVSCYEFGAVADWEHTPNEETQEAMQEVLDKVEGVWSHKDDEKFVVSCIKDSGDEVWATVISEPREDVTGYLKFVYQEGVLGYFNKSKFLNYFNKSKFLNCFVKKEESVVDEQLEKELALVEKYPHYYKDIRHLNIIDIYRFFDLFEVTDPCIQHSLKKMAVGGKRGSKDYEKDIKEAMDTLSRWEYMQEENKRGLGD